jgi:hypothetical protein
MSTDDRDGPSWTEVPDTRLHLADFTFDVTLFI